MLRAPCSTHFARRRIAAAKPDDLSDTLSGIKPDVFMPINAGAARRGETGRLQVADCSSERIVHERRVHDYIVHERIVRDRIVRDRMVHDRMVHGGCRPNSGHHDAALLTTRPCIRIAKAMSRALKAGSSKQGSQSRVKEAWRVDASRHNRGMTPSRDLTLEALDLSALLLSPFSPPSPLLLSSFSPLLFPFSGANGPLDKVQRRHKKLVPFRSG